VKAIHPAQRMSRIPPYVFAQLGRRIAQLRDSGVDVIRIDMGSPDLPPAPPIIETLVESARRDDTHGYAPFGGPLAFRQAVAAYYDRRFGVKLDPNNHILGLVGSKEGLFNLTQAMVDPGDVVLVPDPGYPVYPAAAQFAGAEVVTMPLRAENGFLPDITQISPEILGRTRLMWLNYPNNPTGATADLGFFQSVVDLARHHGILVAHDAPYTEVCFDGYVAPSLLQVPGALDVAVEFNSLSKAYNMAGWRVGMALGNATAIDALATLKSQMDTSQFTPIWQAATAALTGDQSWLEGRNAVYEARRDLVLEALASIGMAAPVPKAALYVWAPLPAGESSSTAFCDRLLAETGVSVTPGVAFGAEGEGYVRISLGTSTERMAEAMQRLKAWRSG
jgi:LL-diaminopimelate aminotransferase